MTETPQIVDMAFLHGLILDHFREGKFPKTTSYKLLLRISKIAGYKLSIITDVANNLLGEEFFKERMPYRFGSYEEYLVDKKQKAAIRQETLAEWQDKRAEKENKRKKARKTLGNFINK
ncbi:MAG: hypothetical protein PF440_01845 [Thiomicrorhabdus sp.]|jgi:hypothetical protein|nr:hypothetical protein [Thiomicrorhabdus sp.]